MSMGVARFSRKFALPLWRWYLGGLIFLAITNLVTLEIPQLAKQVVNGISATGPLSQLETIALSIIGLGFIQILVRSLSRILIFWPGRQLESTSKTYYFERIIRLPVVFFNRYGLGDLISRIANDITHLRAFLAFGVLQVLNLAFLVIFTISKMASAHLTLTLLCLIPISLMLLVARFIMPAMNRYSRQNQDALGKLTNRVTESFLNVHTIQANAAEDAFLRRCETENLEVYRTNMKLIRTRTLFFPLLSSLTTMSQLIVLYYGGLEVTRGNLTVGDILTFNIYLAYIAFPLTSVGIILSIYQRAKTALQRLSVIEDEQPEHAQQVTQTPLTAEAILEIRNLTFSYPQAEEGRTDPVLQNVSLTIAPGQRVGIYARIGSGKSTLFNLICRLYDPPAGTIFWRGRDVLEWEPEQLRRDIGYALQSVHLFSDTIANNLCFGLAEKPSPEALEECTRAAQIWQEVQGFEKGWDTEIGEKGIRLSGGQKQRLALARLFLRKPKLLLLDDVLSAVDNQTERLLIQYIERSQTPMLVASHKLTALEACAHVIFMEKGRIIDQGHFAELAERHPELRKEVLDDRFTQH